MKNNKNDKKERKEKETVVKERKKLVGNDDEKEKERRKREGKTGRVTSKTRKERENVCSRGTEKMSQCKHKGLILQMTSLLPLILLFLFSAHFVFGNFY